MSMDRRLRYPWRFVVDGKSRTRTEQFCLLVRYIFCWMHEMGAGDTASSREGRTLAMLTSPPFCSPACIEFTSSVPVSRFGRSTGCGNCLPCLASRLHALTIGCPCFIPCTACHWSGPQGSEQICFSISCILHSAHALGAPAPRANACAAVLHPFPI